MCNIKVLESLHILDIPHEFMNEVLLEKVLIIRKKSALILEQQTVR